MFTGILRRLRDAIRRKCPELWGTNSLFVLYDNAPAHRLVSGKDLLPTNNDKTLRISSDSWIRPIFNSSLN
jgi:hypothetical protein